jgi:hypothetical protein
VLQIETIRATVDKLTTQRETLLIRLQEREDAVAKQTKIALDRESEIKVVLRALEKQKSISDEREKRLHQLTTMVDNVKREWS